MQMSTIAGSPEALGSAHWPVPEERRTVTVLFADIVGSTGLIERLDPEDVRALQRAYFDTVAGVLRRWNGVVEKYIGDAVMALFGAHGSDGFDAYRAVQAGLEIQRALGRRSPAGTRLRVRVGVATGEALVDVAGTRDGGHGMASGAVITTAARLQQYAPPGGVVVCAATRRATAGLVEQRPLASMAVAGKAMPLDVWRVTGPGRGGPARHHGPLIGRRRELATAGDEIARAVRDRRPRWVSLVGPAGSGRSRLLHELVRAASTVDGVPVRWCVAHCPPYPQGAWTPLADMVRGFAGVRDTDLSATVRRRLATALEGVLPPQRRGAAAHALAELLAASEDAAAADRGADAWLQVLLELAAGQPVVVAVDDLDRAAPALNRFLHRLFAAATERELPLAVVATHGPGWADVLPGAADRRRRVPLPALDTVHTGRLLRHQLRRAGRPAALAGRLLPLVGGNPGVAEAYVRGLDEDGASGARVPEAVRRIVDARLDRLDGEQRAVLMAGAALGVGFAPTAVDRLLGWAPGRAEPVLRDLAAQALLRPARGGYAVAEPAVALVAHDRLPRAVRAEFARRARTPRLLDPTRAADAMSTADARRAPHAPRAVDATPAVDARQAVDASQAVPAKPALDAPRAVDARRAAPATRAVYATPAVDALRAADATWAVDADRRRDGVPDLTHEAGALPRRSRPDRTVGRIHPLAVHPRAGLDGPPADNDSAEMIDSAYGTSRGPTAADTPMSRKRSGVSTVRLAAA
ncbi:Adenylate cyclase, class 3 [Micromonospora rhizosphaerae]|uniref:Adenylate cyclase, class 3 n=1 Tax=Micromonospora rhizosphaerae TaxID=568872 RepID=A0A1C6SW03_9ACTN|nr:adenylate/guanylate cyclase domain-containing protein [Micromonospora rhizosphaerae]SCL33549.1 Adenylate cyclase, class 3 [Micromonospora rhizosphaerae]